MTHSQNSPDGRPEHVGDPSNSPATPTSPPEHGAYPALPGDSISGYESPQNPSDAPPQPPGPGMPEQYPPVTGGQYPAVPGQYPAAPDQYSAVPGQYPAAPGGPGMPPPVGWHGQMPQPAKKGVPVGLIIGIVAAVVVLLVGAVVAGVVLFAAPSDNTAVSADGPEEDEVQAVEQGMTEGSGPVEVDIYLDFMCAHCGNFHALNKDRLAQEVNENSVTVTYHPLGLLDDWSDGSEYSTRAAAASACAAAEGQFAAYADALLTDMPDEGVAGPDDAALAATGERVGLSSGFTDCVMSGTYRSWVEDVTAAASDSGIAAIPHVTIDGQVVDGAIENFGAELDEALGN